MENFLGYELSTAIMERARRDSNPQPSDPKSDALSIELRAPINGCQSIGDTTSPTVPFRYDTQRHLINPISNQYHTDLKPKIAFHFEYAHVRSIPKLRHLEPTSFRWTQDRKTGEILA